MAISTEKVGAFGETLSEGIPVQGTVSGSAGSTVLLTTLKIPEGETWLVSVIGTIDAASSTRTSRPELVIGSSRSSLTGECGSSAVISSNSDIRLRRNHSLREDSFVGHVYILKLREQE